MSWPALPARDAARPAHAFSWTVSPYLDSPRAATRCTELLRHDLGFVAGQLSGDAVPGGDRLRDHIAICVE